MQLSEDDLTEDDNPKEDVWLHHWTGMSFESNRPKDLKRLWKIGLAVSGGSDSMAMLHLFAQSADGNNRALSVATVDHGLRPEAKEEAQFVAETCAALGLPHITLTWTDWDGEGNLQSAARAGRYKLLSEWAKANDLDTVAIGHTQNDVAETFLARLARGSGLDGLAEMERKFVRHNIQFARPCLSLEREMLRRYLRRHNHTWRDDPSNEDDKYQRVIARKTLAALKPLGIDASQIANAAFELSRAKHALEDLTVRTAREAVVFEVGDIVVTWDDFAMMPHEIGRRFLAASLRWVGATEYPPRSDAVQDLQTTIMRRKTGTLNGCLVVSTKQEVRIGRETNAVDGVICSTDKIWDARWQLDGPHAADLEIRALGPVGLPKCPDWRCVGLPRTSLLSSPSIWRGDELIAAPLAKLNPEWTATLVRGEKQFFSSIVPH